MHPMLRILFVLSFLLATACSQQEDAPPPIPAYDSLDFTMPDASQRAFVGQLAALSKDYGLAVIEAENLGPLERKEGRDMTALTLKRGELEAMVFWNVNEPNQCTAMTYLQGFESKAQYEAFRARFLALVAKSGPKPDLYFSVERGVRVPPGGYEAPSSVSSTSRP